MPTSRHDLPWWGDPDYDELGRWIHSPEPDPDEEYEKLRDQQEIEDAGTGQERP